MARKPPRQNPVRDFVKEAHKCGLEPFVEIETLPDGTVRTKMRATDLLSSTIPQQSSDQEPNEWDNVL
jgi:hypothetical protein